MSRKSVVTYMNDVKCLEIKTGSGWLEKKAFGDGTHQGADLVR